MMKLQVLLTCLCMVMVVVVQGDRDYQAINRELAKWTKKDHSDEQTEIVQYILDALITGLVESGDIETLGQLSEALQDGDHIVDKREERQQTINEGKKGHCCLGGKLEVTYTNKEVIVPKYNTTTLHGKVTGYYENKVVILKVPMWTCGLENAICCKGYVTIKRIPGGLAAIGQNNCVESRKALFTIIQLQLMEKVSSGKMTLSTNQMSKVFDAVHNVFITNGIEETPDAGAKKTTAY